MSKASIANASHYKWDNNCDTWLLVNSPELSVKEELIPAGEAELLHYHNYAQQFFYLTVGMAFFKLNDDAISPKPGEGVIIPPDAKHSIANKAETELKFLVISQPTTENDRINIQS